MRGATVPAVRKAQCYRLRATGRGRAGKPPAARHRVLTGMVRAGLMPRRRPALEQQLAVNPPARRCPGLCQARSAMIKLLLALLAAGKLGKVLLTGGTMLLSIVVYAFLFGWQYAVGFVLLLLVHEMGHYIAARQRGLDVGAPTFIPFVGAWISLKQLPHNVETEAYVGMGGPLLGTVGALGCYFAALETQSTLLLALSYAGFFLNLFNLIPLSPFDGGRITAVLSPRVWLLGVPVLVAVFLMRPNPVLIMMGILAIPQVIQAWRYDPKAPENQAYYGVSARQRLIYAAAYIGLLAFLAVMTNDVHQMLRGEVPTGWES